MDLIVELRVRVLSIHDGLAAGATHGESALELQGELTSSASTARILAYQPALVVAVHKATQSSVDPVQYET